MSRIQELIRLMRLCSLVVLFFCTVIFAKPKNPVYYDVKDVGEPTGKTSLIQPWKVISLDAEYGGQWVLAGDVDGDGQVEIVSSENVNKGDVHYTSTAVAQKLDGSVLWEWGNPAIGRKIWHHDVACQIHDWDGNGLNEVVLCTKGYLVELDGATGRENRRIRIADEATDCLVFCNLSGGPRPSDFLVKDRYHRIWAYDQAGNLLWTVKDPGGHRTAHQPRPLDIDGDGRDEIMAGYAMLNADGSVRWIFKSKSVDQTRGHLDCVRIFRRGKKPEDFRLVLTCCGADNVALIDGTGGIIWEVAGYHFESIDVGRIFPGVSGQQIVVDIDHQPLGNSPIWTLNEKGELLCRIVTDYSRHHCLLDWTGDGVDEILVAHNGCIYDHDGKRIGILAVPDGSQVGQRKGERSMLIGDMTGDGVRDVMMVTTEKVYIYINSKGRKGSEPVKLGTEFNFTLY
ncbi:MAG: rhamnogalacturonan lyase family protein [Planctomycetota bacterium]